jgi:hypothetical protein
MKAGTNLSCEHGAALMPRYPPPSVSLCYSYWHAIHALKAKIVERFGKLSKFSDGVQGQSPLPGAERYYLRNLRSGDLK